MKRKWIAFVSILGVVLTLDFTTKAWAVEVLSRGGRDFLGIVPLNLAYNKGAAFGITIGEDPRWFFIPVTFLALILLGYLLFEARKNDWLRILSVSFVIAGAIGNLRDRILVPEGVIDFVGPINLGFMNWPIFNVADMAISCGAVLLAVSFWREERELAKAEKEESESSGDTLDSATEASA